MRCSRPRRSPQPHDSRGHRGAEADIASRGSEHHLVTDANRVPLACLLTAANRNNVMQLLPVVAAIPRLLSMRRRPARACERWIGRKYRISTCLRDGCGMPVPLPPCSHEDGRRLTAVELFCGAGGMALGFEQAGFDVLAAIDLDPVHLSAHERTFPLCEPVADVSKLGAAEVMEAARRGWARWHASVRFAGRVDCVFGGPSC